MLVRRSTAVERPSEPFGSPWRGTYAPIHLCPIGKRCPIGGRGITEDAGSRKLKHAARVVESPPMVGALHGGNESRRFIEPLNGDLGDDRVELRSRTGHQLVANLLEGVGFFVRSR